MAEMARHLGKQLCEAWGLDPNKVKRIVISLDASDVAIAEVSILTDGEMTEELLRLRPIDPAHADGLAPSGSNPLNHPRPSEDLQGPPTEAHSPAGEEVVVGIEAAEDHAPIVPGPKTALIDGGGADG